MYQVITIGSGLVDIFIHSDNFLSRDSDKGRLLCQAYGDKVEVDSFRVYSGGGATNTAVGFARLGLRTAVICETGRDHFGKIVLNELITNEVETSMMIKEKREQTGGSVIMVGEDGGRTIMVHRGASSMLDTYDVPTYWLSKAGWVHLSSIAGRDKTLEKIFTLLNKEKTIGLSWNPGKAELALLADKKLDISQIPCRVFLLNKKEWQLIEPVQEEILKYFSQVIVTEGSQGGDLYIHGKHYLHYPSQQVESIDDTGAGDAFACGYAAAQILSKTPEESIHWGVKNSSNVIRYYGAKTGLLYRERMEKG
jgi:ribokinase